MSQNTAQNSKTTDGSIEPVQPGLQNIDYSEAEVKNRTVEQLLGAILVELERLNENIINNLT